MPFENCYSKNNHLQLYMKWQWEHHISRKRKCMLVKWALLKRTFGRNGVSCGAKKRYNQQPWKKQTGAFHSKYQRQTNFWEMFEMSSAVIGDAFVLTTKTSFQHNSSHDPVLVRLVEQSPQRPKSFTNSLQSQCCK